MRRHVLVVIAGLLVVVAAGVIAYAQEEAKKYTLQYAPQKGDKWQEALVGEIAQVLLQNQPMGVTGSARMTVTNEITAADEDQGTVDLKLSFSDLEADLNGAAASPQPLDPMTFTVERCGRVAAVKGEAATKVDMLGSGGIPLQLLAVLTHVVRFSEEPVAVGDQWDCQDQYEVPGIGTVPINTRWKLKEVTENVASLVSTAAAALPTFKTPNPMVPGADMDVKDGKVLVTELKQQYDMGKSRVTSSQGTLKLQASVDMQGMAMAVTATVTFSAEMAEEQPEKAEKGDKAG